MLSWTFSIRAKNGDMAEKIAERLADSQEPHKCQPWFTRVGEECEDKGQTVDND